MVGALSVQQNRQFALHCRDAYKFGEISQKKIAFDLVSLTKFDQWLRTKQSAQKAREKSIALHSRNLVAFLRSNADQEREQRFESHATARDACQMSG